MSPHTCYLSLRLSHFVGMTQRVPIARCARLRSVGGMGGGESAVAPGNLRLDQRQQLTPVGNGIFVGLEAADQDVGDPGVVVVEDGSRDPLRRAPQGGGVATSAGSRGNRHPEARVENFLLRGEVEQSLRS